MDEKREHNDIFKNVFIKYYSIYEHIFSSFYPSLNSTGFQERNLSVNFSKAYESIYPNSISWFEFQIKRTNHVDLIIIDDDNKRLILVEAKRYTSPSKENSISNDVLRMHEIVDLSLINDRTSKKHKIRVLNLEKYDIYGVILADVWSETDKKKRIVEDYTDKEVYSFSEHVFDRVIHEEYKLVSKVWIIRKGE